MREDFVRVRSSPPSGREVPGRLPLVSIILPTYNRVALLKDALDCVSVQMLGDWECIVVDDGSTDGTPELLAQMTEPRLRIVRIPHSGNPAVSRNAGLSIACGTFAAFLDDDDLWKPEKLTVQVDLLRSSECRWSYTGYIKLDTQGRESWRSTPDRLPAGNILRAVLETRAAIALPTVMAERSLLNEVGGFDVAMRTREDHAMWLKLAEREPVVTTPMFLTIVRDHPGRIFRPEGNRIGLVLYRTWLDRVTDPGLRRICRERIADAYLREARRLGTGRPHLWLLAVLRAFKSDVMYTGRRLSSALGRRVSAVLSRGRG